MNFPLSSFGGSSIDSYCQPAKQRLCQWTKPDNHDPVLNAALELTRSKRELLLENMLLRQQLIVLKRQVKRPALTRRNRTLFVLLASKLSAWKAALVIVQPDSVLAGIAICCVGCGDLSRSQREDAADLWWLRNSSTQVFCAEITEMRYHAVLSTIQLESIAA